MNRIVVNDDRIARFVAEAVGSDDFTAHGTIGVEHGGEVIAGIVYDNFNGANICLHVGARPGANWLSRKLLKLVFGYPFEQLGCRRVTGLVPETNWRSRRFCEHLGFELETRIRAGAPDGDVLVYSMFREQCRFLGTPYLSQGRSEKGPVVRRENPGALSRCCPHGASAIPIKIASSSRALSFS